MMRQLYLLFMVLLTLPFAAAFAGPDAMVSDSLTVSTTAYIEAEPDIVDLNFELFAVAPTLKQAKQQVDAAYQDTLAIIKKFNIAHQDVQLTQINSRPEYDWQNKQQVLKGQRISRTLRLTIRQLAIYPEVLAALIEAGVSEVHNINTRFSNRSQLEQAALAKAAALAQEKATFLAAQFGRSLGSVEHITEGRTPIIRNHQLQQRGAAQTMLQEADASLPMGLFGVQKITASVAVVYRLQ